MTRVLVKGGRVIDPASRHDAVVDVCIGDGRLLAIGEAPAGFQADLTLDAGGCVVCPGLIDLRARLREPGAEHKATVASETRAAVAGGVTTVCVPPDTEPAVDTPAVAELINQRAAEAGFARVEVLGALTQKLGGELLAEMGALSEAGCAGVSNALRPVPNTEVMRRALEYAATFGLTTHVHAEDAWLAQSRFVHDGGVATRLGLPGIPAIAETIGLARELLLVEETGARVHFCHLSTAAGVEMVRDALRAGLPVSADVAATHLHLCDRDLLGFETQCHLLPPLRSSEDRDGLRAGVADGSLSVVCSDHQPHEPDAKLDPFAGTQAGAAGLESLLSLVLALVDDGVLGMSAALARVTSGPATVLGLARGRLAAGLDADLCIFEPDARWTLDPTSWRSRGRNTPLAGREMRARVRYTLVAGRLVFDGTEEAAR